MTSSITPVKKFDEALRASDNERIILDIVRRRETISRSTIKRYTNLTQQSVHRLVETLMEGGLLRAGAPFKGTRGQPSPTIELVREAIFSVGISINTDSATLCLADFACNVVAETTLAVVPNNRRATLLALLDAFETVLEAHRIPRQQLLGLGFSMAESFVFNNGEFKAPEPLHDWSLVDLRVALEDAFAMPVWLENSGATGAIGESLRGAGLWCSTFAYLSFNYGLGGGLILGGRPFLGFHGNAGEFSTIFTPDEASRWPALQYLIKVLRSNGISIHSIKELRQRFDPSWPGVDEWLDRIMPQLDRLVATCIGVIDPEAIVFGGELPRELGRMMIRRVNMPVRRIHRYGVGPAEAQLVLSEIEGDAAAMGAALLPLKACYFL